ncbi:MAG: response regulator [Oligoflexia bacterium]|nr:response regulator [Oligoflexia bacterium]
MDRNSQVTILLVEDTPLQAKKTIFLLNKLNFKVIWSLNGKLALEDLQKTENYNIDIIITDMQMPEMDGLELVKQIKSHKNNRIKNIPVIVMTSFGTEEACTDSITIGADDFINKPFKTEEITLRINNLLDKKKTEALAKMQLEAIESSMDGMAILNRESIYLFANKAQLSLFAYKELNEIINIDWKSHFKDDYKKQISETWPTIQKQGKWSGELYASRKDGSIFPIETSVTKITNDLFVCVSRDITKRKLTEQYIDMMINSLDQGLIVFDVDGKCLPNYTKAIVDLFQCEPTNKFIWDLITNNDEEIENVKKWIKALFEQKIPFKDLCKLGPASIKRHGRRFISLDYHPMYNESKNLVAMVMVATDNTQEHQAKLEAQKNLDYANMIVNLIKNKKQFTIFIKDAQKMILELNILIEESIANINCFDLKKIRILLHSLKGGYGVYSLTDLQMILHNYESELEEIKDYPLEKCISYLPRIKHNISILNDLFMKRLSEFHAFLGDGIFDGQYRSEINISELKKFSKQLSKSLGEDNPLVKNLYDKFIKFPIIHLFQAYNNLVLKQAQKRGKLVENIIFQGGEIKVDADNYTKLSTVLEHAFINIIDHGIELPAERVSLGKPQKGRILVSFAIQQYQNNDILKITIQDDGKGIDPGQIREKLHQLKVPEDKIEKDDNTVIQHIFDETFSLTNQITMTSGRGIGMGAIKSVIEDMGGVVVINSLIKKGTKLVIVVPFI